MSQGNKSCENTPPPPHSIPYHNTITLHFRPHWSIIVGLSLCQQLCTGQGVTLMVLNGVCFSPHPCPLAMVNEVLPVQLSDSTLLEGSHPSPAASASESYISTG